MLDCDRIDYGSRNWWHFWWHLLADFPTTSDDILQLKDQPQAVLTLAISR